PTTRRTSAFSAPCASWSTTSPPTGRSSPLTTLPLLAHSSPDAVVAYRAGAPLRAREFLADVMRVREALGPARHVLNACADRYHFTVGFAAGLVGRKVSLLPSTHTPEVIRRLREFASDAICLTDRDDCDIGLPQIRYPRTTATAAAAGSARLPQ